jgi:hypothetical protein
MREEGSRGCASESVREYSPQVPGGEEEEDAERKKEEEQQKLAEAEERKAMEVADVEAMVVSLTNHTHPRVVVEASIKLTGAAPVQDFIVNFQELLKNGQFVDKMFAFCPIDPEGTDKKIHETSGIPSNVTMPGAHFKILSSDKNPFEKQKQWGKANKDKEEFRDPIVYFSLAMTMDKNPKDLLSRIIHEWQRHGGILLRVKDLQSFESDTILAFYNIFTSTPKNYLLQEFCSIFQEVQTLAQEIESTDFIWAAEDLLSNSTLPAMELHLQNPKLPGQHMIHFNKLSRLAQANWKAFYVECNYQYAANIKKLTQLAKEADLVTKM